MRFNLCGLPSEQKELNEVDKALPSWWSVILSNSSVM